MLMAEVEKSRIQGYRIVQKLSFRDVAASPLWE